MNRRILCFLLLLALVLTGCAHPSDEVSTVSTEPQYLTRINFYSRSGSLLDQFRIEYDPTGVPVKISSGITSDQRYENALGGAPILPDGVQFDKADSTYRAVLLAPCAAGTALLVTGTAQEPLWGMVLYGDDYTVRNGYITKVTAGDGSYAAFFYSSLTDSSATGVNPDDSSFSVTENSAYYGYDAVLTTLGTAVLAMQSGEPAMLNEMLFSTLYDSEPRKDAIGYTFMDLDGNGTMELLVGSSGQYARTVIYDLYAIYNGRIVNVLSGTESARHTLAASNDILVETTNDAGQTDLEVYSSFNSSLRLIDALIQGCGLRYHSTQSFNDDSTFEEISYTEAAAIQERYSEVEIEFTPLLDYIEAAGLTTAEE